LNAEIAQQALASARVVCDRNEVTAAIDRVSVRISARLRHADPVVLCVLQGGFMYHAALCARFAFPMQAGYLHVGRYGDHTSGGALEWHSRPSLPLAGRSVLVVDDILDQGATLAAVLDGVREQGAEEVLSTVLVDKQLNDPPPRPNVDFVALTCPDEYLFGYGMDVSGYWRNLPEIYALSPEFENPQ